MRNLSNGLKQKAGEAEKTSGELFKKLKKKSSRDLDNIVQNLHYEVFSSIDCLQCANCCQTLGPRITDKDIERLSKYLRVKPSLFTNDYLKLDEDGDYVFKIMPCPFLLSDHICEIYEKRPKACREYPHTNRKKFHQLLDLTLKNTFICPAVYEIVEGLKIFYGKKS